MNTYERVTFRNGGVGKAQTVILRNPVVLPLFDFQVLSGIEVDAEGSNAGTLEISERRHVIALDFIISRTPLVMSNHYGRLVKPTTGATS